MSMPEISSDFAKLYPKLHAALSPYDVYPVIMANTYPRLLQAIEDVWGHLECVSYINSLLFTNRKERQGFSADAMDELVLIKNIFEFLYPGKLDNPDDPFNRIHEYDIKSKLQESIQFLRKDVNTTAVDSTIDTPIDSPLSFTYNVIKSSFVLIDTLKKLDIELAQSRKEHLLLGQYLVEHEGLEPHKLEQVLAIQNSVKPRQMLGKLLLADNSIFPINLIRALCQQRGIPLVDAAIMDLAEDALNKIPLHIAQLKSAIPLLIYNGQLVIAVSNPFDNELQEYFSFLADGRARLVFSTPDQIQAALARYTKPNIVNSGTSSNIARTTQNNINNLSQTPEATSSSSNKTLQHPFVNTDILSTYSCLDDDTDAVDDTPVSFNENDETVINMVNNALNEAISVGASDVHIEAFYRTKSAQIRFRKDGAMEAYSEYPISYHPAIISRLKILAKLDISEKRKPQDGKISYKYGNQKLDLRISTIPTTNSLEVATIRLLSSGKPLLLSKSGMHPETLDLFRTQFLKPFGLILVCGPTGSGKTTTLHSVLQELNTPDRKIWTAEDPVEIVQHNISQVQVMPKIGWTFEKALRSFLRADPDVIMVGEIRDSETAKVAVEASMTGHLVLSTLHTNSAAEALSRLVDLEVKTFNLADAAQAIMAQRLVRRTCSHCGEAHEFSNEELEALVYEYFASGTGKTPSKAERNQILSRWRAEFSINGKLLSWRATGCDLCNHSGYLGRLGIHELLVVTTELKHLIRSGATTRELYDAAMKNGMKTLKQDGIEKVIQGFTDMKEVRTVCI